MASFTSSIARPTLLLKPSIATITNEPVYCLPRMSKRTSGVKCSMETKQPKQEEKSSTASASAVAVMLTAVMSSPAMALVDERMSTEGTGLPFGIWLKVLGFLNRQVTQSDWSFFSPRFPSTSNISPGTEISVFVATLSIDLIEMFYLSELEHTLRVPPHLLNLPLEDAIKSVLQNVFLDKVLTDLGLCVSVYDIKSVEGGIVLPGVGAATYKVGFRIVVFRPFVGEVIAAKFKESDANGLRLTLGFFEDIYVPAPLIPTPNRCEPDPYNRNQKRWVWEFGKPKEDYIIDDSCQIKFRVESISYPSVPTERAEDAKPFAPMVVTGNIDDDGLGPVSWWESFDQIDQEE
ncbi:unnamed protein product [Arabis nemorensis]|uniref:DNA-directed RNA polymerase subunit n=1 Tax=Arabis nemorensis TaxID=586526 RepID=A0A565ALE9_9BRAS|nr:unnamed protein product [Arabis nemorensis]